MRVVEEEEEEDEVESTTVLFFCWGTKAFFNSPEQSHLLVPGAAPSGNDSRLMPRMVNPQPAINIGKYTLAAKHTNAHTHTDALSCYLLTQRNTHTHTPLTHQALHYVCGQPCKHSPPTLTAWWLTVCHINNLELPLTSQEPFCPNQSTAAGHIVRFVSPPIGHEWRTVRFAPQLLVTRLLATNVSWTLLLGQLRRWEHVRRFLGHNPPLWSIPEWISYNRTFF